MATNSLNTAASFATLAIVCLLFFIDIASLGMANIALPTLQRDLGYNAGTLQWVLTAYSLAFGGFLMVGGRLADMFGHKKTLIFGTTLFNISSLVCAVVNNQIGLVVARAFQGLAAAFTIPSAQSMVALSFDDPKARVRAFSVWGACGSSGFVFGPIIGGLFTSLVTWEWIFWFSLIAEGALEIGALALLFTNNLPGAAATMHLKDPGFWGEFITRIDPLGTFTSVAGLILLVYGLTQGNVEGWQSADVIATLVLAVVLLSLFVFVELKVAKEPILPKYLWSDKIKVLGCASAALTYAVWQGSNYLLTLELQSFGFSALSTALRFLPLGITAMVVNFIIPSLMGPIGPRILLIVSWVLTIAGILLLVFMDGQQSYWRLCLPGEILYIAGIGTIYFVGNVTVVATAKKEHQGTVSGVYNMFLNVGGAVLGVAVLTVITDSVTSEQGGSGNQHAVLLGYRAGYYGALAMSAIGLVLSFFFVPSETADAATENDQASSQGSSSVEQTETKGEDGWAAEGKTSGTAAEQESIQAVEKGFR